MRHDGGMNVSLIADTIVELGGVVPEYDPSGEEIQMPPHDADMLAEFAGRACYQSWSRPNAATAKNYDYIGSILDKEHFSVLEHASATFYITGVSRSLTHELVRHRHLAFSQLSQRYVDESDVDAVIPPALRGNRAAVDMLRRTMAIARGGYESLVDGLIKEGLSRKEARQAARAVLPNMTETRIVVTGNHRAWREVIAKRMSPGADVEIQKLAAELLRQLRSVAPATYQDFALPRGLMH